MAKIAVFFAEGFEEIEGLTVVDICRRGGINVETVSVTGSSEVTGSHGITVKMDRTIEEISFEELDMLVLPGGMPGTKNLEACDALMQQLDAFALQGKYVAAICAAPSILGHRGILKGKKACCYPGFESHLDGAQVVTSPAQIDGKVITGRGMGAAIPFGLAILEVLVSAQMAQNISDSIIYSSGEV